MGNGGEGRVGYLALGRGGLGLVFEWGVYVLLSIDSIYYRRYQVDGFHSVTGYGTGPPGEFGNLAVKISTPSAVTRRVCSAKASVHIIFYILVRMVCPPNCAVLFPSIVTAVQLSGQIISLYVPSATIGSIVKHIPSFAAPTALFPA